MKKAPFTNVNPNGRVPAIEDPNTGIHLWESGAIVEYLVETYDKQNTLSYGDKSPEKYQLKQWLHFQMVHDLPSSCQLTGQFLLTTWLTTSPAKVPTSVRRPG